MPALEFLNIYNHRNGITGSPFYTGEFRDDDGTYMFVQFTDKPQETSVFRLRDGIPDLQGCLRGDYFAEAISKKIDEVTA